MPSRKLVLLVLVTLYITVPVYSQRTTNFDSLRKKAYEALDRKEYKLCASLFERAIGLPDHPKQQNITLYYDIACAYSLDHEADRALMYLQKSFETSLALQNRNPVSITHIMADTDLDFIRNSPRFSNLLDPYYPKAILDYVRSKEVSYSMVLDYLAFLDKHETAEDPSIENKTIYWEKSDTSYVFNENRLAFPNFDQLKELKLSFINCRFKLNFIWDSRPAHQEQKITLSRLEFRSCQFEGRFFAAVINCVEPPNFSKCQFRKSFALGVSVDPPTVFFNAKCQLDSCTFNDFRLYFISKNRPISLHFSGNTFQRKTDCLLSFDKAEVALFENNNFDAGGNFYFEIRDVETLKFKKNKFHNLIISDTKINQEFDLQESAVTGKILLRRTAFTDDPVNDIDWEDISDLRLGLCLAGGGNGNVNGNTGTYSPYLDPLVFNSGKTNQDISNKQSFRELMGLYSMFLNLYKNKSDLESYNACFITLKELQSKRLNYLYESHPTFETYFSWKLSQLLKFYVRYGTSPARAIVISLYIVFWFGVFFFFFPSDWDVTSKKRLIQNFKDFVEKNEKGYVVPFFVLLGGFGLSLINALTLSLNAFITLGFGNIPTHGLARYVCVIEGFMGWFLLSIFTVALINQVL